MKTCLPILLILLSVHVFAQETNLPYPGESFPTYFARITRGGRFPGIYLDAPENIQSAFFNRIKKGPWVGLVNEERAKLQKEGVNLWQDWYLIPNPGSLILGSKENISQAEKSYKEMIATVKCPEKCPEYQDILSADWNKLASWKRELWIKNIVLYAPVFNGHTLLWYLTQSYALDENIVEKNVDIKILDHNNFVTAVHDMGYGGEVYFRGITGLDPKNSSRHWILLDDEYLRTKSPFEYELYKMMEIPGILIHELSHVCQDLEGTRLGYSIEVTSAEDALMIEGMAEAYAERAILNAGTSMGGINPWPLFIREQAVEIVYREGNETTGNLFPYTIGLPFVTSLLDLKKDSDSDETRRKFLNFLDATPLHEGRAKTNLSDWTKTF